MELGARPVGVGEGGAALSVAVATGVPVGEGATVGWGVRATKRVGLGTALGAPVCAGAVAGGVPVALSHPAHSDASPTSPMATTHVFTGALYPAPARPSTHFDNEAAQTL